MFALFVGTVVYSAPSSAPVGKNADVPITQLDVSQTKDATLTVNSFLVGNWKYSPADLVMFTTSGKLGVKIPVTDLSNLPTLTDTLTVGSGGVRLAEISIPGVSVCADSQGTLIKCLVSIFSHSGDNNKPYETYIYTVPTGVTEIIVELYGAGGAGWGEYNRGQSPDSHSCSSGGIYYCDHGGSAFLYDINGTTILAEAKGGRAASAKRTGGTGGSVNVNPTSSKKVLSGTETISGDAGEDKGTQSAQSSDTSGSVKCGKTNISTTVGGVGGIGGKGGKAGKVSATPGGLPGVAGSNIFYEDLFYACNGTISINNGKGYLSEGGINGQFGAGGSGAGGIGGFSDPGNGPQGSTCSGGASCPTAEDGYAAGGGGGYVKLKLDVKSGEKYHIKLSHGGVVQGVAENKGDVYCYSQVKWTCTGGSYSGNGSGAYAKVTVN